MTQTQQFTRRTRTKRTMLFPIQYPKIKYFLIHQSPASKCSPICWPAQEGMLLWAEVSSSRSFPSSGTGGPLHSSCTADFWAEVPLQSPPERTVRGMHSFLQCHYCRGFAQKSDFASASKGRKNNCQS